MHKVTILILADSESHGDMGRITNALEIAKEFKEHDDEIKIVFDGAGTTWIGKLADPESKMNPLYESVKDKVMGACSFCAGAFGVKSKVEKAGVKLLDDYDGHPSVRALVEDGYQVMTF
jgi:hypothetical protein